MTRQLFHGGRLFDGTGAAPALADVAVEDGRIVAVGTGLDGDNAVDLTGRTLFPGFFDCHVHVTFSHVDLWRAAQTPFSYRFFEAAAQPAPDARRRRSRRCAMPAGRTSASSRRSSTA